MNKGHALQIRLILAILILFCCIGCDQATKGIATRMLQNCPVQSFFADTVRMEYVLNPGGFLGLGSNLPDEARFWIFVGVNSCILLALCAYLLLNRHLSFGAFVSVIFMLAGGVGNQIDRIWNNGLVTDFINVGVGSVRTGVFNVADMAVTFGVVAAVFLSLRRKPAEPGDAPTYFTTYGPPIGKRFRQRSSTRKRGIL